MTTVIVSTPLGIRLPAADFSVRSVSVMPLTKRRLPLLYALDASVAKSLSPATVPLFQLIASAVGTGSPAASTPRSLRPS